jgi:hypothetical protein
MKTALPGLCVMLVSLSSVAQSWRDDRARLFTGKLTVRFAAMTCIEALHKL